MEPTRLQRALEVYGVESRASADERVRRQPLGGYVVELGAAGGSAVDSVARRVPFFEDGEVAALAARMLACGSTLTPRRIHGYVVSLAETTAELDLPPPPEAHGFAVSILDGDARDSRLRRAKIHDFPPALLRRYDEEATEGCVFGDTQAVVFEEETLALLALAIERRHNRADAEAVLRCLSRALDNPAMMHGLTRHPIDRLPAPEIAMTFGDLAGSCRIGSTQWLTLHHLACGGGRGLRWRRCADAEPPAGTELLPDAPAALREALAEGRLEFSVEQWYRFGVRDLKATHVVEAGGAHFRPADGGGARANVAVTLPVVIHVMRGEGQGRAPADAAAEEEEQFATAHIFLSMWGRPQWDAGSCNCLELRGSAATAKLRFYFRPDGGGAAHLFVREEHEWIDWCNLKRERWRARPEPGWRMLRLPPPPSSFGRAKRLRDLYEAEPLAESKTETTSLARWKRSARHCGREVPIVQGSRVFGNTPEERTMCAEGLVARRVTENLLECRAAALLRSSLGVSFGNSVLHLARDSLVEPLGLKWHSVGTTAPSDGRELTNDKLSEALKRSTEFTVTDLKDFELPELKADDYIKSDLTYFQVTVVTRLNCEREDIEARVAEIVQWTATTETRALIPLARSIHINPRSRYPLIVEKLPLYLTPRAINLATGKQLVLARTPSGLSDHAETLVANRFTRGILQDLKGALASDRFIAAVDLLLEGKAVGALVLRKYKLRTFGVHSQGIYIDCIVVDKEYERQGIGNGVLDALWDMVAVGKGTSRRERLQPCYVWAQCVRDHFWELRASATHDARALTLQLYLHDPTKEHLYRDCTARSFMVFDGEAKGQSPPRP